MRTTFDIDDKLYRRLKGHAAMSGTSVKTLVTEAIRRLLENPTIPAPTTQSVVREAAPRWVGSLAGYADHARGQHDLASMRASVVNARQKK